MGDKRYRITLTEQQLRVVRVALEEYFRLRLGQDMDFCDDIASMNTDLSADNPEHNRIFDRFICRRNCMRELMAAFFRIAFGPHGVPEKKTADMLIAEDIWDAIRVHLGISRYDRVLHVSDEPIPDIEVLGEGDES